MICGLAPGINTTTKVGLKNQTADSECKSQIRLAGNVKVIQRAKKDLRCYQVI